MKQLTITETAAWLKEHDDYLVICHKKPDGDALGSASGLVLLLRKLGKRAYMLNNPETTEKFVPFAAGITAAEDYDFKTVVTVDTASVGQFCIGAEKYADRIDLIIDHHISNTGYGAYRCLEDRAACGEIIYEIACALGMEIDGEIADRLYTAVSTDTGCFAYGNTTSNTLRTAAALADAGADLQTLNKILFRTKTKARAALDGYMYSNIRYYFDERVAVAPLSLEIREKTGVTENDLDDISALPIELEGVKVGVTLKEQSDGGVKVSLRTMDGINASEICASFGGGGHIAAAGCYIEGGMEKAEKLMVDAIGKVLS